MEPRSDLDNGKFIFPSTMMNSPIPSECVGGVGNGCTGQYTSGIFENASHGYGNYNAGFATVKMADWRGLTMQSNFTWSKALGTGAQVQSSSELTALDPYNPNTMYGKQAFDRKFIYNAFLVYQPPFYKGQSGMMGRVLGGWTFAGIFTAGTGLPIQVVTAMAITSPIRCDGVPAPTTTPRMPCRLDRRPFTPAPTIAASPRGTPVASPPAPVKRPGTDIPSICSRMGRTMPRTGVTLF